MANAIEFFLTRRLQGPDDHPKGWEWWVLDREGLQQDILQILLNKSSIFAQKLLGHDGKCTRQPERSGFDLLVRSPSGQETFIEIKVDADWNPSQQEKQMRLLPKTGGAKAALILFSQGAGLSKAEVQARGRGLFSKISYAELYQALDELDRTASAPELREFAAAYKTALVKQEERTRDDHHIDPNC